jgi:GDP-L-fucose synthase
MDFWNKKRILVTGGAGFLGKAVVAGLLKREVLKENIIVPNYPEYDLRHFEHCSELTKNIDIVIHLAAKVGGILFNKKFPGSMMYDNIMMGFNLLEASRINNVKKVVLLGTTCSYPENAPVPFKEEDLWNGYPAEVTAPYGIAKKTLLELAKGYEKEYGLNSIFLLPVNLYGPNDNFCKDDAHVIPALIQRFIEAVKTNKEEVIVWGSGNATREFLFVEDAAEGILKAAEKLNEIIPVNLGTGIETSIREIVDIIADLTHFKGKIVWDYDKPDGTPRRSLDISKALEKFGFKANKPLDKGIFETIEYFENYLNK